jgi:hypothetical protein
MKLYTIKFEHYSTSSEYSGIEAYVVADNEEQIYEYIASYLTNWSDKEFELVDKYDDKGNLSEETWKEKMMRERGDFDTDIDDCYYGVTQYQWNEGKDIFGDEYEVLSKFITVLSLI